MSAIWLLCASCRGAPKELECIGASLDLTAGCVLLSVWVLDFGCETWLPSFTPCAIIRVLHDVVELQVWPVVKKEALGIRLPIRPLRALVAGLNRVPLVALIPLPSRVAR